MQNTFGSRNVRQKIKITGELDFGAIPAGEVQHFWVQLVSDGISMPIRVPVMVAKGGQPGPTLALTAAIHGNELNGIPIVQQLFRGLDAKSLSGTLVGVPGANIPALLREQRRFLDGRDLNRIMPGKPDGDLSQVYAHRFMTQIIRHVDYLVDIHTASAGRVNSLYIRADLRQPEVRQMAMLQNAQIVLNSQPSNGTLRRAAADLGIHTITLEVGDPGLFQPDMIQAGLIGTHNLMAHLGMWSRPITPPTQPPVVCRHSHWMHTDEGGLLHVWPALAQRVTAGEHIATLRNTFGELLQKYYAPEDGVVIGKSVNPINQTGGRILHLGIVEEAAAENDSDGLIS